MRLLNLRNRHELPNLAMREPSQYLISFAIQTANMQGLMPSHFAITLHQQTEVLLHFQLNTKQLLEVLIPDFYSLVLRSCYEFKVTSFLVGYHSGNLFAVRLSCNLNN